MCVGHKLTTITKNNIEVDLNDGYQNSFYVNYLNQDEAGHINGENTVTYKLPNGYRGLRVLTNYDN